MCSGENRASQGVILLTKGAWGGSGGKIGLMSNGHPQPLRGKKSITITQGQGKSLPLLGEGEGFESRRASLESYEGAG